MLLALFEEFLDLVFEIFLGAWLGEIKKGFEAFEDSTGLVGLLLLARVVVAHRVRWFGARCPLRCSVDGGPLGLSPGAVRLPRGRQKGTPSAGWSRVVVIMTVILTIMGTKSNGRLARRCSRRRSASFAFRS